MENCVESARLRRGLLAAMLLAALILTVATPRRALGEGAKETPPAPLNDRCEADLKGFCNYPTRLYDNNCSSNAHLKAESTGAYYWTDEVPVGLTYWEWYLCPKSCTFAFLDANRAVISEVTRTDEGVRGYLEIPEGCYGVRLTVHDECELTEWHFYEKDRLPDGILLWEPALEKCDIMLIVAHSDDELVMMGGIIPTYATERGCRVQVVYCYVPERNRAAEALAGLRYSGMTTLPVIFFTEDEQRLRFCEKITEQIRRFQPEVVITHDPEGEYGNPGHVLVARDVQKAIVCAADAESYPDTAAEYGVWQIKKLYLHLYPENQIRLDFDTPLASFDGKTAFEIAQEAYAFHKSQRSNWLVQLQSNRYDCRLYGLKFSTVGDDAEKNDFLENIPDELLSNFVPTPEPTVEPTPTPTPTAVPTPAPTATPDPAAAVQALATPEPEDVCIDAPEDRTLFYVLVAAGLLVLGAVLLWLEARRSKKRKKRCR